MTGAMIYDQLTVGSLIDHAARFHAGTEVVSVETSGEVARSNWGEVSANARRLASALNRLGVAEGARVGTIAWNNRRHLEIYFGVASAGRVTHTINPRLTPEQIAYIANHAGDEVLMFDTTFLPLVAPIRTHLDSVKHLILLGPRDQVSASKIDGLLFYDELLEQGDPDYQWPDIDERSPAAMCYTSGTTGNPKGVQYSHRSIVLHSIAGNQPDGLAVSARDSVMPVVPMFHVNAWGAPYIAAQVGARLVLPGPDLHGDSLARLIDAEGVTLSLGVPTIWMGLLAGLQETGATAATMTRTVVGGAALPPSMIAAFRDKYGVDLIHAWGMTETSPLGTLNQLLQKHEHLSAEEQAKVRMGQGRPPWGVDLRIVDDEGARLPHDGVTQGSLQIRGHWIVERYYGQPDSALTPDGWFDTGDIATIDPDGYMIIRDRAKDIIKSGGEWISTVELENIAIACPGIANAAAIAAYHPKWDERPVVIAVRAEGADITEADLLDFYDGKVAKWQIPDRVVFVDALPSGATGKILKNRLREAYRNVLTETA
ncbi:fatty-acyl-CoA synthase [Paracoccus halophilus]|uniref:Fatty-acyl-CoA synthase n=1 Tax=Paracoccus halophilus TaxID=376733 RepID=A0A099F7U1_9RHOB|nr:long-chain fatty acid--CoA ligase [Paracoccus halophilus]KGJ06514.1 long-chain fatty acid--CoA ligase [Paracoccus halophilus]SFA37899.1 fatty-acyl-CoA synthase [Paracoccus halophilus]